MSAFSMQFESVESNAGLATSFDTTSPTVTALVQEPAVPPGNFLLPIRGEKRISLVQSTETRDISPARHQLYDFLSFRIEGRGRDANGNPDGSSAYLRFPINPSSLQVSRQTLDAQSFSKGGWQIGVWGEDFISISLSGKTGGRYYASGLAAATVPLTISYRSLEELEIYIENNGYWFEGEALLSKLSPQHRQIKQHGDVELTAGEFIWTGMFDSLEISEDANEPYLASFTIQFSAWRERYRASTPYPSPIGGAVERGHFKTTVGRNSTPSAQQAQQVTQTPASITSIVPASTEQSGAA